MANMNEEARIPVYINDEQAKSALKNLTVEADKWRKKMVEAMSGGDMKGLKEAERELGKVNRQMNTIKKEAFDVNKVLSNISTASAKDLKKAMTAVNRELDSLNRGTKEYQLLANKKMQIKDEFNKINGSLKTQTGLLGGLQQGLSLMPGAFGRMAEGIMSVGKATLAFFLTPVGAIVGIVAAIGLGVKSLISNSVDFGKAASSLSAITGAVGKDLDFLKKKAREIAKDSTQSATDMLKAFQTIGGAMPELLKNGPLLAEVTRNAVMLSESTGGELDITAAAKAAAAALNQFNLPLTESARAVNVLAAGSLAGASEVDNITESLKNLGPVASTSNMSLENTIAAIEVVAEKSILGAEAGTKLRGVILRLQAESLGYASGQFNLKDAMVEANKIIDAQATAMEKDAYLSKLFGVENITVGKIMLDNVDKYEALTKAVTGTNTAYEQAKVQQDNQDSSNKKFGNAWKNMMLSIEDGNGILARAWKGIVDGATWLLNGITSQFENLGASVRAIVIFFTTFYDQMKAPLLSVGNLLKAVFTLDYGNMKIAFNEFKTSLAEVGKDGSLNIGKIAQEQLRLGAASKAATAELRKQKEELSKGGLPVLSDEQKKKASDKAMNALDEANNDRMARIVIQYEKEGWTDSKFKTEQMAAQMAYLIQKQALLEKFGQSTIQVEAQISQKRVEAQKMLNGILLDGDKELIKQMEDSAKAEEKAVEENIKKSDKTTSSLEKSKNKEKKILQESQKNYLEFGQAAGESFASLMLDNEATLKDYLKATLLLALEALHQYMLIEEAKAIAKGIATGPAGIGIAVAKVAAMEAAYSVVKGLLSQKSNYYDGGYTASGNKYEPAGIVHAGEYVIPQEGTQAPGIRPIIDIMEIARQNGSLARLDLRPVMASIGAGKQGFSSGGSTSGSGAGSQTIIQSSGGISNETISSLERIAARFEQMDFNISIKDVDDKLTKRKLRDKQSTL